MGVSSERGRVGDVLLGRFHLRGWLGEGGMGQVYSGFDAELQEPCAVKLMRPEWCAQPEMERRFVQELKLLQSLSHPGIVRAQGLHRDPETGRLFLVMELLVGHTLATELHTAAARGSLPLFEAEVILGWIQQLAEILEAAHGSGVIHRDVKPQNIVVLEGGGLKLLDFGIARFAPEPLATHSHTGGVGTFGYMAPEQLEGRGPVSAATDVYSLAALTYRMLTGRLPVGRVLPPSRLCEGLPVALDAVVFRGLELQPEQRIPSPDAFARSLRESWSWSVPAAFERPRRPVWLPAPFGSGNRPQWLTPGPRSGGRLPQTPALLLEHRRRVLLGRDGTPLLELVEIPGGPFVMGSSLAQVGALENQKPQRKVHLDPYWIARTPVTNQMWQHFLDESGYEPPPGARGYLQHWGGAKKSCPEEWAEHPVVFISYLDAWAFCDFYGLILPSEAQWEKAARGVDGRSYPWGEKAPDPSLCHCDAAVGETRPVGATPLGASPYGLLDCAGNALEWCADQWEVHRLEKIGPEASNPLLLSTQAAFQCTLRGGDYLQRPEQLRCAYREGCSPRCGFGRLGFRPALVE